MVVGSPLGGRITARVGPRPPIAIGLVLITTAIFWISALSLSTGCAELWVPTAMMGFGVGLALTPMNLAATNAISRDHAGAAAGLLVTLSGLGATLGVAVTGALFNELNTQRTMTLVGESGVSIDRDQAQTWTACWPARREPRIPSTGSPARQADAVHEAIREAFVSALGTSLKISAGLVLLGLILSMILMRRTTAADATPIPPVVAPPTPRPAPRGISG